MTLWKIAGLVQTQLIVESTVEPNTTRVPARPS